MTKVICAFIFIFTFLPAAAQDLDSLKRVAASLKHDTERVNLFYNEGFGHRATDPQYSYDCAHEALTCAQLAAQPYYTAKAFNLLGILYYRRGDLSTALFHHHRALELRQQIGDSAGIALSQTNLGNVYYDMELYRAAEQAYLEALALNTQLGKARQAGNCLLNLGALAVELKQHEAAENYFRLALANARLRFDYELEANCLNNLAELQLRRGQYEAAIASAMNSLKIKELMDNSMEMADSYLILGEVYLQKKENREGRHYLRLADSIIAQFGYLTARLQSQRLHAAYEAQEQRFEPAYAYLQAYLHLKDSLAQLDLEAARESHFMDAALPQPALAGATYRFPSLYFWTLCGLMIGCGVSVYRLKR